MSSEERFSRSGDPDQQRLLRSAADVRVPPYVQEEVRRAVEARLAGRMVGPRRWRTAVIAAGLLIAGTAAAQNRNALRRLWDTLTGAKPSPTETSPRTTTSLPTAPNIEPLPSPPADRTTALPRAKTAAASPGTPAPHAAVPPTAPLTPELDAKTLLAIPNEPAASPPAHNTPPKIIVEQMSIARDGREPIVLSLAGNVLHGRARGASLSLTVTPTKLTGRIGEDEVLINVFGTDHASGTVGGREIGFTFNPTETGWIVGASLPDVGGRVALDRARLSFYPGCDNDLGAAAARPGTFEGKCSDGTHIILKLAPGFLRLPDQVRMIILGMLLPEPEPVLRGLNRGLFPSP